VNPAWRRPHHVTAACAALASLPAQQRTIVPITSSAEEHLGAVLNPAGTHVAFRGPNKIAAVPYAGGPETVLAVGTNLGSFVWAADSRGIYFMEGTDLKFVGSSGGPHTVVLRLPETNHALWDVKNDGSVLLGTWFYVRTSGTPVREWQVFSVRTDGTAPPTVLRRSVLTIDGVRYSPDDMQIAYREYDPTPFQPIDLVVAGADGSNPRSLTNGQGLQIGPTAPWWDPTGSAVCFARTDPALSRQVIERIDVASLAMTPLTFPTRARNMSLSLPDGWILYEGFWQAGGVWTPVLMPVSGGGHVFLDPSRPITFTGTPHMDASRAGRVVLSGNLAGAQNSQVLKVELAREIRAYPRIAIGQTFQIDLPLDPGEIGALMLAASISTTPLPLPGLAGAFAIDPPPP
jgi:hypothetical protein